MCEGIALGWRELPEALIEQHQLGDRRFVRNDGADPEIQFLFRHRRPLLPVWNDNQLIIAHWGNKDSRLWLPRAGWLDKDDMGTWNNHRVKLVKIPANYGFERGIWYQIKEGIKGLLVLDAIGIPNVYMLMEKSSHYYQIMTRSRRMPVFVRQTI